MSDESPPLEELNRLLVACGERPRLPERWRRALLRSHGQLALLDPQGRLSGYIRLTSDQALNANLWDLLSDPMDPFRDEVITILVQAALARLRRELNGCSI